MLFKQFTVVAIVALAASTTAIPFGLTTHPVVTDPAVMGAQDPSLAVITQPSAPVHAGLDAIEDHDQDDEEDASKWGGGWGSCGGWGWPWWCYQPWWCW
ncbi:hypothetical protein BGZ93_009804 [Podila epicladia]|nr:hypothetical protein BGZ92_002679 [Podila epicladia]KAG0089537.1 hypothetical protein BGZ93_009804 [Podila epicladia]